MIGIRKNTYKVAEGDVNKKESKERETMAVGMEMVGLRGYYGMKAINECEGMEEWIDGEMGNSVSQSMKPISPGTPSPVESLIKSPCRGFCLLPDGTTSVYMSCLTPDQQNYNVL